MSDRPVRISRSRKTPSFAGSDQTRVATRVPDRSAQKLLISLIYEDRAPLIGSVRLVRRHHR